MKNLLTVLPLAFVMIAGPQIISAVFFATSQKWKGNSAAYVGGAALSITSLFTIAYFVVKGLKSSAGSSHQGSAKEVIDWVVLALLLFLVVRVFLGRKEAEPPKWMGKLQTATPKFAFTLGFLLLGVFPTDIITSITVGSRLAAHGDPWWHGFGFVLLTLFLLAVPVLLALVLGKRAEVFLPKVRDWMNTNSWVVSELVIVLFIVITINSIASD